MRWVAQRTARGVFFMAAARGFLFCGSLVGGICLARFLTPADFGVYAVVSVLIGYLNAFAQLNLNTTLIHDADTPSLRATRSVFTLHALIAASLFFVLWATSIRLASVFRLEPETGGLFHLVGLLLLIQPFSSIPSALLRRHLAYDRLALVEVVSVLVFQGTAVTLAVTGYSYWSFGWAALASWMTRTVILHVLCPWRIGIAWDTPFLLRCVRFGGAFQLIGVTGVFRDNIITLLGGPLFGPNIVGLLSWSRRFTETCSQEFVAISSGVAFPSLSRMRFNPDMFGAVLTKMLRYVNWATLLTLSVVTALAPQIVHLVFTDKWISAIPFVYCFAFRMVATNYTTLLDSALAAQGRPQRSLMIQAIWTAWEWCLALLGVWLWGPIGIAAAYALGAWLPATWLYREVALLTPLRFSRTARGPFLAAAVTFAALAFMKGAAITTLPYLFVAAIAGSAVYIAVALLVDGYDLFRDVKKDVSFILSHRTSPLGTSTKESGAC